ncbi:MAG: N(4)-(beta-N-acetylglucosaminyl)-L-asparaginase [Bernardetiaceae bacterium]|jgi:isoaspartyl peptidase/L-asparaginase-like protein (Ntn-hydrolase superfamily)|nr:N(4)-(beta-N-acetylglucosaminyl)-L-asparaginase [Bernardetiaceae bacterium]
MTNRRTFLQTAAGAVLASACQPTTQRDQSAQAPGQVPLIISTWNHGLAANAEAWAVLQKGGSLLDAVEAGVRISEADPKVDSVGYGGLPDRDGRVTLDACLMTGDGRCGSVAALEHILHPISVARQVMEKTPHAMLVGEGALRFALANGFAKQNLLTPEAEATWREWLKTAQYAPRPNAENHDTIGLLAVAASGQLAGACTTSGLAYKMHGRVGDSPIIGAGLYVDNEVGAATATGLGEAIIRVVGSHAVVEAMRAGHSPQAACRLVAERLLKKNPNSPNLQVGFLAVDKDGRHGAIGLQKGFTYALHTSAGNQLFDAEPLLP